MNKRQAVKFFRTAVLLYAAVCLGLFAVQRDLMYFPNKARVDPAQVGASEMQVVSARTSDGLTLQGWYKPPSSPDKPVIVHYHGNAGSIAGRPSYLRPYMDQGYGLLLAEYRGFGGNGGKMSEQGFFRDAEAWLQWVLIDQRISPQRVILYGESLGTGIATQTALNHLDIGGLILESAYTSFVAMAYKKYPFLPAYLLVLDRYETIKKIGQVKMPLLMIHGEKDSVVPFAMGRRVFDMAGSSYKIFHAVPQGDHNTLYDFDVVERVAQFIDGVSVSQH